jgi:hypothetical protein
MVPGVQFEVEMVERAAHARLVDEMRNDGVKVVLPIGARAIDMLASVESGDGARPNVWVPLTVVAVRADGLSSHLQGARVPGLLIALVWHIGKPGAVRTFAFTPAELTVVKMIALIQCKRALSVAETVDPTCTRQTVLRRAIEPFAISPGQWRKKLVLMLEDNARSNV